jgi:hypothetical protein
LRGLLLVALTTLEYGGGFSLIWVIWMFPAGLLLLLGGGSIHGWPLVLSYAIYVTVWVTILRARQAHVVKMMLALHAMIVLFTVAGCHNAIKGLPH